MKWPVRVLSGVVVCGALAACGGPISNNLIDVKTYLLRSEFGGLESEAHLRERLAAEADAICPKGWRILRAYPNNDGAFGGLSWEIRCR